MPRLLLMVLSALFAVTGMSANAATYNFNTSDSQFDAGVNNQGWWSATEANTDNNDNTFTGRLYGENFANSFYTFDLSGLSLGVGETIIGTTVTLFPSGWDLTGVSETIAFYSVDSTDVGTLNNNVGTSLAIYNVPGLHPVWMTPT